MEKSFLNFLNKYHNFQKDKVVVAVSGGVDSMVLLELMIRYVNPNSFAVGHFNHGLRKESKFEQAYLKNFCQEKKIKFYTTSINPQKKSEDYLRQKRYQFLEKAKKDFGAKYIMMAHQANDQAETVLLNLVRGTGPISIWGMKEEQNGILRPLLNFTKAEISKYAKAHKVKFFEDKTNRETKYTRNLLRKKVIPQFETINPKFVQNITKLTNLGHDISKVLENEVNRAFKKTKSDNTLNISELQKFNEFIQKEVIRKMLFEFKKEKRDVYEVNIDKIYGLINLSGSKKTHLGKITILKEENKLIFNPADEKKLRPIRFNPEKELDFGGLKFRKGCDKNAIAQKNNILIPENFTYNLRVRTWKTGDRIETAGGTKKLQDLFTDAKIARTKRKNWPIFVSGGKILWVPLVAASKYAQKKQTKKSLIIEVSK